MINISEINEYTYCPRRYWYIKHGINPSNEHLEEGNQFHKKNFNRDVNNLFFENRELGLKGKVDYLTTKDKILLYELKNGKSRKLWENDKLQTLAYMFLAKKNSFKINRAFVKYREGNKFEVNFKKQDEQKIQNMVKKMKTIKELPPKCENLNKCKGCNLKQYCWV